MPASAPAPVTDLIRFVLARLDEEDLALRHAPDGTGVAPADLERRITESHARREVVLEVQQLLELRGQPNEKAVRDHAVSILRSLATPYADHPDFREQWHAATR